VGGFTRGDRSLPPAMKYTMNGTKTGGWVWRGTVVWDKTEACRPAMGRFAAQCEYVVWGTAGPSNDDEEVGCLWGVIREPVRMADKHHVTGKPTAVMQRLVRICAPGGVVLDPFAGSGTTGVAALLEGRRFLGVEVAGEYAQIARERLGATRSQIDLADYRAGQTPLFPLDNARTAGLGGRCGEVR
jgi:site-specific DNA-methyltransferase (adenine-specific)